MSVKIEGLDNLVQKFDNISELSNMEKIVGEACAIVERDAKENAPRMSGALRESIQSKVETIGSDIVGTIFSPLEYAPYVEFGTGLFAEKGGRKDVPWKYQDDKGEWHTTKGQKPHPFLNPALEENRDRIVKILKEGLNG